MLVLTRKDGEGLIFSLGGEEIIVNIFEATRNKVKLGVAAPKDVIVIRSELRETERENTAASAVIADIHAFKEFHKNASKGKI